MANWGLLLINLGTPDAPRTPEVRRYLREFLMDPRVIDKPWLRRALIVHLLILPIRPQKSAAAYRQIWTERGSPLLFHGMDLVEKVRQKLGDVQVELAMRYQNPSVRAVLETFQQGGVDKIVVFPLFPQYSSAAWGSAVEKVFAEASRLWNVPTLQVIPPFYDHPAFLDAFAGVARPVLDSTKPEKVLMSFHGLPQRHVQKSDDTGSHCLSSDTCCDRVVTANRNCYRAHCFATARGLAERLKLSAQDYLVTFQSRLGRDPWIRPHTDEVVVQLARDGVQRLVVLSPAFVADCLETLEEIALRARNDFQQNGGAELRLVPSLNSEDSWTEAVVRIVKENITLGAKVVQ